MQTLNQCKVYVKSLEFYLVLADTMCMTTHNASRQYIAADLTARAESAGIDIHDEYDFPTQVRICHGCDEYASFTVEFPNNVWLCEPCADGDEPEGEDDWIDDDILNMRSSWW